MPDDVAPFSPEELAALELSGDVYRIPELLGTIARLRQTVRDREWQRDEIAELAGKVFGILNHAGIEGEQVNPAAVEYLGPDQIAQRLIAERDELQRQFLVTRIEVAELKYRLETWDDIHAENMNELQRQLDQQRRLATVLANEVTEARTQLTEARNVLSLYAEPTNWKCARCGKHDPLNCYCSKYVGPLPLWDGEQFSDGSQPWEAAREVIDAAREKEPHG